MELKLQNARHYYLFYCQIDQLTYESTLIVDRVGPADYGPYECLSRNELGFSSSIIRLDVTSAPGNILYNI